MHALEGIIAAIVLFFYFSSASLPPLQNNEWTYNSMKQAGTEYLNSIERSDASESLTQDSRVLSKITNAIFESSDISIMKQGVPPEEVIVGLLGNSGNSTIVSGGDQKDYDGWCLTHGWHPDGAYRSDCLVNDHNDLNVRTVLVDLDRDELYDAVYLDLNDDEANDAPSEGPFFADGYADIGTNRYYITYIDSDYDDSSIKFVNVTTFNYFENSGTVSINGRATRFIYYLADMSDDISQYSIIMITDPIDITPYFPKLKNFLLSGKGIVEAVNMTDSNYNSAQADLFGLTNTSYGVIGNGNEVSLSENSRSVSEPMRIKDYFLGIPINVNMLSPQTPPYDVSNLSILPLNVRIGFINLSIGDVSIAIANNSGTYDSFYVDSNKDYNFSNPSEDATPYAAGDSFSTPSGDYVVKSIDPNGNYAGIRPSLNASLANIFNPLRIGYDESSWPAAEQNNQYTISGLSLFESFNISLADTPILGDDATLLSGNHTFGEINEFNSKIFNSNYNIAVTNISGSYFLNADLDNDLRYNGLGEGPFANGDVLKIGPETYIIDVAPGGYSVKFTLFERDAVPAVIAGNKYSGRTVWMPYVAEENADSWNYVVAAMLWASPKNEDVLKSSGYSNIVSSKKVFIRNDGGVFQPYVVEFSRRYG